MRDKRKCIYGYVCICILNDGKFEESRVSELKDQIHSGWKENLDRTQGELGEFDDRLYRGGDVGVGSQIIDPIDNRGY